MTNSTYRATVNKILALSGQEEIASSAFDDDSQLTRFQSQCKALVDLSNRMLLLRMNERFTQRSFVIQTANGTVEYSLDASINAESILYHSFYCKTSGAAMGPIQNWDYLEFRQSNPVDSSIPNSAPRYWILIPSDSAGGFSNKIRFYPNPDGIYDIEYQAKLNAQPLVSGSDLIVWTPEYEHALWLQGRLFLEQALGEGKEADIALYAERAVNEVKMWGGKPNDVRQALQPGLFIRGPRRARVREITSYPISE